MPIYVLVFLSMVLLVVAYYDIRWRRIPNYLNLAIWTGGMLTQIVFSGWVGLKSAVLGSMLGGGLFAILYLLKWMGGGDVKLVAAVGTWLGIEQILAGLFYTVMIGGVLALAILAWRAVFSLRRRTPNWREAHQAPPPARIGDEAITPQRITVPYGVAIVMGSLLLLFKIA